MKALCTHFASPPRWTSAAGLLTMVVGLLCSCSSGGEGELPDPKTLGDVSYNISHTEGTGNGTASSPAVATAQTPAQIDLSQKSTYNDPDGSTYECEPHASVKLSAANAAIDANSIAELTTIKESSSTTAEGTNPVTKHTVQTFTIGKQTITFDLQHEVYTHTDSHNRTVEMPYLRLSNAHHGAAQAKETRAAATAATEGGSSDSSPIAVTGIRLTPLSTRGSVTTQQPYHVSVSFTVDVNSENTDDTQQQTLAFQVEYDATVETTTEFPDPATSFT